jgi:hypothetical protein
MAWSWRENNRWRRELPPKKRSTYGMELKLETESFPKNRAAAAKNRSAFTVDLEMERSLKKQDRSATISPPSTHNWLSKFQSLNPASVSFVNMSEGS